LFTSDVPVSSLSPNGADIPKWLDSNRTRPENFPHGPAFPDPDVTRSAAGRSAPRPGFFDRAWIAPAALVLLTSLVYARSLAVPIHDWDDHVYFFRDARLEHLSAENLWRILTQPFFSNFHPLTTLTFAFDRAVWGTWVAGFHVTQLALYAGGVLGLYFLFARILGRRAEAFTAAAIYAAHTVHVESVAWLASRKDVVCLLFYALALLAYVRYAGAAKDRWRPYALSAVFAGAAMLSKGYAVILPAVFFAYDFCYSNRITRRQVVDKLPFLALAATATLLTIRAQDKESALIQMSLTGGERLMRLAEVLARYIGHTLLPIHLSAIYATGLVPAVGPVALLGFLLALALAAGFLLLRRRLPAAAFGIALFVLPLATVMNVYYTLRIWMTDRYLLFPTIGSSLAVVALAQSLYGKRRAGAGPARAQTLRRGLAVAAALVIGLYSALTVARIGVWTSGVSLWSDVLRNQLHLAGSGPLTVADLGGATGGRLTDPGPLVSLKRAYQSEGNGEQAAGIDSLLSGMGGRGDEHSEMKLAREDLAAGRYREALRRLEPVAGGKTWFAPLAMFRIGVVQDRLGNAVASREAFRRAIEMYREHGQPATDAYFEVGTMEYLQRNFPKAVEWYRLACRESPSEANPAFHLGLALEQTGSIPEALQLYRQIVDGKLLIAPNSQFTMDDVILEMGVATQKLGRREEAIGYFEQVLHHTPNHPKRAAIEAQIASLRAAPGR
jgi:tetratricopeptide (TPR) repeat protein